MLIRLCYLSKRVGQHDHLIDDIVDILTTARKFNQQHQIYGVLYYADNTFFQCLEGEQQTITALYDKIQQDERHVDVTLLLTEQVEHFSFTQWSMKYVERSSKIYELLQSYACNSMSQILPDEQQIKLALEQLCLDKSAIIYKKPRKIGTHRGVRSML